MRYRGDDICSYEVTIYVGINNVEITYVVAEITWMHQHMAGTSWKALWGSGLKHSDLSGKDKSRFQYLAGRPVDHLEGNLDNPLSATTAANPFGNNFHY